MVEEEATVGERLRAIGLYRINWVASASSQVG
jgi:hypothetical protein